jgi:hypothetical protein
MPRTKSKSQKPPVRSPTRRQARMSRPGQHRGLEQLRRRFEAFRDASPPNARIPVPLRQGVLALLRDGVARSTVMKTCGVSWTQLERWTELYAPKPSPCDLTPPRAPRVLSVVDDAPSLTEASEPLAETLELRLGRWSVTVRPTGNAQ